MAEIKLNDEEIQEAVQAAILGVISEDQRKQMIAMAVKELLAVNIEEGYGKDKRKVSQIQIAFERAVWAYAQETVGEMLKSDEHGGLIRELITEAFVRVAGEERYAVTSKIAEGISEAVIKGFKEGY